MELVKFTEKDFDVLVKNIDSSLEMMIWAGPKYRYPLTFEQLKERMDRETDGQPKIYMFSLFDTILRQIVGFIEIEIIADDKRIGSIQSVMIFKKFRGKKLSEKLVALAGEYSFNTLQLNELELKVFSFNTAAVACYKKEGFKETEIIDRVDPNTGKSFQLLVMKKENKRK